jgi:hypothetical protein
MFTPASILNSSPAGVSERARATRSEVSLPGSAFATLMRSCTDFTGRPGYTTSSCGAVATMLIGTKSRSVS